MSFIADKQTLEDLNIPGRYKNNSVSRLFDHTLTAGGSRLMENLFQYPLTDAEAINQRSAIFEYFTGLELKLPFDAESFALVENYLRSGSAGNQLSAGMAIGSKRLLQLLAQDKDYELLMNEVCQTIALLNQFHAFSLSLDVQGSPYEGEFLRIKKLFGEPRLAWLQREKGVQQLSFFKLVRYDYLLRSGLQEEMKELTTLIFQLDVYLAVSGVAFLKGFRYAKALPAESHQLIAEQLRHPALENARGNAISLTEDCNVLFLTGANMAGKSTLMKSIGIGIYLAHMGFPVAAERMEFSVKDGLYTSINVPDNLGMGYSHFYAEVLRVKKVAEEVASGKNLVAIFDELFKGTNVKDAYDATLSITEAFSDTSECFFIVSTHIIEVGESLAQKRKNFKFVYLPTVMDGHVPRYTYQLEAGISSDRQGMMIIQNEGIIELLSSEEAVAKR